MKTPLSAWAFVPARGGSKSIRLKNLVPVCGNPLINYGVWAAQRSGAFDRIVCSTDSPEISRQAASLGIEIDQRPAELGGDDIGVSDVVREFLQRQSGTLPDVVVLVQLTSPFLKPEQITALLEVMALDPLCQSAHNVTPAPHNFHPWNGRIVDGNRVEFLFAKERLIAHNKQRKPKIHFFGNLVAARSEALLRGDGFFASPMATLEVGWPDNFDLDQPADLGAAEALVAAGVAQLVGPA